MARPRKPTAKPAAAGKARAPKRTGARAAKPAQPAPEPREDDFAGDDVDAMPPPFVYPAQPPGAKPMPAMDMFQARFVPPPGLTPQSSRRAHVPSSESRAVVAALAQFVRQPGIAEYLGISEKTLREHYRAELDVGQLRLLAAAGGTVALFANRQIGEPKQWLTASMFVLNTRGGWATKHEVQERVPVTYDPGDAAVL